ncbi:MAG: glycosyltransferase, partial [Ignavibacteriales bacterium]|nr:glycosyltransferase [Ignavibacteriales bacterium]
MNIVFATYHSVMLLKGGPRTQVLQSKRALEKLDVQVYLFDSWKELDVKTTDLVHLFGANIGTYHLARELHRMGVPFVVSPIFFTRRNNTTVRSIVAFDSFVRTFARGLWSDYGLITDICKWAKLVLPNTTHEAKLVEEGFGIPNDKIIVIPNGVEERFYFADPSLFRQTFRIENFILNVGHIGPERKNVFRLIKALEEIPHPAVIIGRIEQSQEAQRCLDEAKKNSRLKIIEYLPNDSDLLASAYAACDTFVLPGQFETPGIA